MRSVKYGELKGSENTFAWNDLGEFKGASGDFMCMADNNTYIGAECDTLVKGEGNRIFNKK